MNSSLFTSQLFQMVVKRISIETLPFFRASLHLLAATSTMPRSTDSPVHTQPRLIPRWTPLVTPVGRQQIGSDPHLPSPSQKVKSYSKQCFKCYVSFGGGLCTVIPVFFWRLSKFWSVPRFDTSFVAHLRHAPSGVHGNMLEELCWKQWEDSHHEGLSGDDSERPATLSKRGRKTAGLAFQK